MFLDAFLTGSDCNRRLVEFVDRSPDTFIKRDEMRAKIYMKRPTANKNDSDFITFGRECRANFLCKLLISKGEDGPPFYRLRGPGSADLNSV